jgi:hypothetical protein
VRIASKMSAVMALAVLGTVALAAVAAPASAAPEVYNVSVSASGVVDWSGTKARRAGEPLPGRPLVLPGRTRAGVATAITCTPTGIGPSLVGGNVFFSMNISCQGGVPQFLQVWQNIARHIAPGNWVVEPDSNANCPAPNSPTLVCGSVAPCYREGATYDAYAVLYGVDEFGVPHWSSFYAPPRWIGCII